MTNVHDQLVSEGRRTPAVPLLLGVIAAAVGAAAVAMFSFLQIVLSYYFCIQVLSYYFCIQEVGTDLHHPRSATGQVELDLTPVVVCQTPEGTMEFPIAPAVASLGTAIVLLVVLAVVGVVCWARR